MKHVLIGLFFLVSSVSANEYKLVTDLKVSSARLRANIFKRTGIRPPVEFVKSFPSPSLSHLNYKSSKNIKYPEYLSAGHTPGRASGSVRHAVAAYAYAVGCNKDVSDRECRSLARYNLFALPYAIDDARKIRESLGTHGIPFRDVSVCEGYEKDRQNYTTDECCYYIYQDGRCDG